MTNRSNDIISLAHGGGGQLTDELLSSCVMPRLNNEILGELLDSGILPKQKGRIALTIDGYVVQPTCFPGGNIGKLAICGTVNDLAVCGAEPLGIALGFILAEGLGRNVLEEVTETIAATAKEAGVKIITGDTKVVGRGQADGMYITTAGVGVIPSQRRLHPDRVKAGDVIIINGPIADHGMAVMLAREFPQISSEVKSDVAPLNGMITGLLAEMKDVAFMRDATRGGLAGVAADLAQRTGLHICLEESEIPIRQSTRHAADMLGLDPLDVANEGKVVIVVKEKSAQTALDILHRHEYGREAKVIGRIEKGRDGMCELHTAIGGRRIVQKPYGEQLARIC